MSNLFKRFKALLADPPLTTGVVLGYDNGVATVSEPGGGQLLARGTTVVGETVFVRNGVIEGQAPDLPVVIIEV